MPAHADPLARLRPIHWPEPVSWWPPAPVWWAILIALALIAAILLWRRYSHPDMSCQSVLTLLDDLQTPELDDRQFLLQLNLAMKQIALECFEHHEVATLTGDAWLAFLDATLDREDFVRGAGRVLGSGPYCRSPQIADRNALLELCRHWAIAAEKSREAAR